MKVFKEQLREVERAAERDAWQKAREKERAENATPVADVAKGVGVAGAVVAATVAGRKIKQSRELAAQRQRRQAFLAGKRLVAAKAPGNLERSHAAAPPRSVRTPAEVYHYLEQVDDKIVKLLEAQAAEAKTLAQERVDRHKVSQQQKAEAAARPAADAASQAAAVPTQAGDAEVQQVKGTDEAVGTQEIAPESASSSKWKPREYDNIAQIIIQMRLAGAKRKRSNFATHFKYEYKHGGQRLVCIVAANTFKNYSAELTKSVNDFLAKCWRVNATHGHPDDAAVA
jgi:hypothetical protein